MLLSSYSATFSNRRLNAGSISSPLLQDFPSPRPKERGFVCSRWAARNIVVWAVKARTPVDSGSCGQDDSANTRAILLQPQRFGAVLPGKGGHGRPQAHSARCWRKPEVKHHGVAICTTSNLPPEVGFSLEFCLLPLISDAQEAGADSWGNVHEPYVQVSNQSCPASFQKPSFAGCAGEPVLHKALSDGGNKFTCPGRCLLFTFRGGRFSTKDSFHGWAWSKQLKMLS